MGMVYEKLLKFGERLESIQKALDLDSQNKKALLMYSRMNHIITAMESGQITLEKYQEVINSM